jgi:hypothetical protein
MAPLPSLKQKQCQGAVVKDQWLRGGNAAKPANYPAKIAA